jgi:hypothetical protein
MSKQNGRVLYTYFCLWNNDPIGFAQTRVQGNLPVANASNTANIEKYVATYAEVKSAMDYFLSKSNSQLEEDLMPEADVIAKAERWKLDLGERLEYLSRTQ